MLKTIFAQETRSDAEAQWEVVAFTGLSRSSRGHVPRTPLRERQPKLGTLMDASRDDVLAYMSVPREHWTQIASTNPLESGTREVKRRADVIGIFPNDAATVRPVGASGMGLGPTAVTCRTARDQRRMAVARRYMSLPSWGLGRQYAI